MNQLSKYKGISYAVCKWFVKFAHKKYNLPKNGPTRGASFYILGLI